MSSVRQEDIKTAQTSEQPDEDIKASSAQKNKQEYLARNGKLEVPVQENEMKAKEMTTEELETYLYEHINHIAGNKETEPHEENKNEVEPQSKILYDSLTRQEKSTLRYIERSDVPNYNQHVVKLSKEAGDPIDKILEITILILLRNLGIDSTTHSALHDMTELSILYMGVLFKDLHKYTEIQRRRKASKADLLLLLKEGYFGLRGIVSEFNRSKKVDPKYKKYIHRLNHQAKACFQSATKSGNDEPSKSSPDFVFFHKQPRIVPSESRKSYIPKWMPELPPGYTYKSTPTYSEYMTDPKELRSKLIAEGRLGEKALHNIKIAVDGSESDKSVHSLTSEDDSGNESAESEKEESFQQTSEKSNLSAEPSSALKNDQSTSDAFEHHLFDTKFQRSDEKLSKLSGQMSGEETNQTGNMIPEEKNYTGLISELKNPEKENQEGSDILKKQEPSPAGPIIANGVVEKTGEQNVTANKSKLTNNGISKDGDKDKNFDIMKYAEKRLGILSKRKKAAKKKLDERQTSEEAVLGKYLGSYTQYERFPDNYSDVLFKYYEDTFNDVGRNLRHQRKRRLRRIAMEKEKKRKMDIESQIKEKSNSIEVGGFSENMDTNIDEDVDFEMEFSDAEAIDNDMQELENKLEGASNGVNKYSVDEGSERQKEVTKSTHDVGNYPEGQTTHQTDKKQINPNDEIDAQHEVLTKSVPEQGTTDQDEQPSAPEGHSFKKIKLSLKLKSPSEK